MFPDPFVAEQRLVSVSVVARLFRQSTRHVRDDMEAGRLRAFRSPHHWRISRSDLEQFVAAACAKYDVQPRPLSPMALMTVKEVAATRKRSTRTIRLAAESRRLPAFKLGRAWRFWRADIEGAARPNTSAHLSSRSAVQHVQMSGPDERMKAMAGV